MNELALFAGAGGGILAGKMLGWRTVCAVEWEPYAACVLAARQNDKLLPPFPIWDDVQTFDGRPWRGIVDVVSGGFPCQDISVAGRGAGIDGERSGMWKHMARIIGEVRPRFAFVENSPMLCSRGLGTVLGDLAEMGFDAKWGVLGANDVGAPHKRDRIWIVAYSQSARTRKNDTRIRERIGRINRREATAPDRQTIADIDRKNLERGRECHDSQGWQESFRYARLGSGTSNWYAFEPNVGRVVNGVAARVDRLKSLGNGQVPQCAAEAWRLLSE